jgi:transposase
VPAFAVEGCGSYGAGLARFLELAGVVVWECERPRRRDRRRGKSDLIDAAAAGRRLLAGEGLCLPRGGGRREELRLLLLERRSAIRARTATVNQRSALLLTAPAQVRGRLGPLSGERLARAAARQRSSSDIATAVLHRLGRRVEHLSQEVAEFERTLAVVVTELAPELLGEPGRRTGLRRAAAGLERRPETDGKRNVLCRARGHQPGRGLQRKQQRHRLNRGGDRQPNWAYT